MQMAQAFVPGCAVRVACFIKRLRQFRDRAPDRRVLPINKTQSLRLDIRAYSLTIGALMALSTYFAQPL
jgi:hypothetical protein